MDLKSGMPWWLIRSGLMNKYQTLQNNVDTEVVIVGSGITGALAAHFLCEAGVKCTVVDKRMTCTGSTTASTAQLQYEIDVLLYELCDLVGTDNAVKSYQLCLEAITTIKNIASKLKIDCGFEMKSCLYLASEKRDADKLKKEFEIRKKYDLPVEYLDRKTLKKRFHMDRPAALYNECSAQLDAYSFCTQLLEHHIKRSGLEVYSYTEIVKTTVRKNGILLDTDRGHRITAKRMVCAPGFESEFFLDEKVMQLNSTYVLVSQPVMVKLWPESCMVWETAKPYLYIRTTADNRVMVGGEDEKFVSPEQRDKKMRSKVARIIKKFHRLFPGIEVEPEFEWCGVFGETKDGLPYIGQHPDHPCTYFALGYGGNGITFSVIAAEIIRDLYTEKPSGLEKIFAFNR